MRKISFFLGSVIALAGVMSLPVAHAQTDPNNPNNQVGVGVADVAPNADRGTVVHNDGKAADNRPNWHMYPVVRLLDSDGTVLAGSHSGDGDGTRSYNIPNRKKDDRLTLGLYVRVEEVRDSTNGAAVDVLRASKVAEVSTKLGIAGYQPHIALRATSTEGAIQTGTWNLGTIINGLDASTIEPPTSVANANIPTTNEGSASFSVATRAVDLAEAQHARYSVPFIAGLGQEAVIGAWCDKGSVEGTECDVPLGTFQITVGNNVPDNGQFAMTAGPVRNVTATQNYIQPIANVANFIDWFTYTGAALVFTVDEPLPGLDVNVTGPAEVDEPTAAATHTYTVTVPAADQTQADGITLNYEVVPVATADLAGTSTAATADTDFTGQSSGSVTLTAAGDGNGWSGTFDVNVLPDNQSEGPEMFKISFDVAGNTGKMATLDGVTDGSTLELLTPAAVYPVTILPNDTVSVTLHASQPNIAEGQATIYTVRLTDGDTNPLTDSADICVNVRLGAPAENAGTADDIDWVNAADCDTAEGSAAEAMETAITALPHTFNVEVPAGDTEATFTVMATADEVDDAEDSVEVSITDVTGGVQSGVRAASVGAPNLLTPALVEGVAVVLTPEGTIEEGGNALFVASIPTLDSGQSAVTLTWSTTAGGTAGADDFTAVADQTFTLSGASNSHTLTVNIAQDNIAEGNEDFTVEVTAPTMNVMAGGGELPLLGSGPTTVTIPANDPLTVELAGNGTAVLVMGQDIRTAHTVSLTDGSGNDLVGSTDVTFNVSITGANSTSFDLCDSASGTCAGSQSLSLTIPAGMSSVQFWLKPGSGAMETHTASLAIAGITGGGHTSPPMAGGSITSPLELSVTSGAVVSVVAPDSGEEEGSAEITFSIPSAVAEDITVSYTVTVDAAAEGEPPAAANDLSGTVSGNVTISAGETSAMRTVGINDDKYAEMAETYTVEVTGIVAPSSERVTLAGATVPVIIAGANDTGSIADNDPVAVSLKGDGSISEGRAKDFTVEIDDRVIASAVVCVTVTAEAGTPPATDDDITITTNTSGAGCPDDTETTVDTLTTFQVKIPAWGNSSTFSVLAANEGETDPTAESDAGEMFSLTVDSATGGGGSTPTTGENASITVEIKEEDPERRAEVMEYVLAAFTRSTVDSVISTVSDASRQSMMSAGAMKMRFAGENLMRGRDEENLDRMTRVVTNLLGMDDYTDQSTRERHMVKALKGVGTNSELIGDVVELPDLRQVLGGTDFRMALNHGDGAGVGAMTAWGQGDFHSFGRKPEENVTVDGDAFTANLGFDFRLRENTLMGVALSHSQSMGGIEFSDPDGIGDGEVDASLTSVHPFVRWESPEGVSGWGMVGIGRGSADLDDDDGEVKGVSTSMRMAAVGGRSAIQSMGDIGLAIKGDASVVRTDFDAKEGIDEGDSGTSRIRVALEGSTDVEMSGAKLRTSGEVGMRVDGGDVGSGAGLDVGANVGYRRDNLSVGVKGSILLAHSDDSNFDQWGLGFNVTHDATHGGRGMKFSVAPTWGAPSGKKVWGHDMSRSLGNDDDARTGGMGMESKVSYGLGVWGSRATLTPFSRLTWSQSDVQKLHLGTSFDVKMTKVFSFEVDAHHEYARDAEGNNYFLGLETKYRF